MLGTASTLRLNESCWNSEHPSPDCLPEKHLDPSALFFFFVRPRWGPAGFSSLRPRVSSLNSEHPSPESIMLEQRAPFAGMYHAGTASTLRLNVSCWNSEHPSSDCVRENNLDPSALFFFVFSPPLGPCWFLEPSAESLVAEQRAPFAGMYHARTASTLRLTASVKSI